jgi:hypothetical protein
MLTGSRPQTDLQLPCLQGRRRCHRSVRHIDGVDYLTAVRTLGIDERPPAAPRTAAPPAPKLPQTDSNEERNRRLALAIWNAAVPIVGTPAATYLLARKPQPLTYAGEWYHPVDRDSEALRFHPHCPFGGTFHPCMIGLFRAIEGNEPRAIHRTALTPEGGKIDRLTLAPIAGAAIKLTRDEEVSMGLAVGEGIETTLSGMAGGSGRRGRWGSLPVSQSFPSSPALRR